MTTNAEMYLKCMQIEALVASLVLSGITDNKKLVTAVDNMFHPTTEIGRASCRERVSSPV